MRYLLVTTTIIAGLAYTSSAMAQTCTAAPSCEEMGYTQSASDCTGKISLRCPFDLSAYLCLELGSCDFSDYPLSSCPTGGNCSNITCDGTTKHKLNSCNSGYTQSGNTCNPDCDFTNYPLASCPSNGNCSNYSCGGTTKYKLNSCNSGYNKNGNTCVYACSGYYECGGDWQYCEGYTCSADSSMCSEYCEDDYFPYSCDSESLCDDAWGVYRDGYCSEECEEDSGSSGGSSSGGSSDDCDYGHICDSSGTVIGCEDGWGQWTSVAGTINCVNCPGRCQTSCEHGGDYLSDCDCYEICCDDYDCSRCPDGEGYYGGINPCPTGYHCRYCGSPIE